MIKKLQQNFCLWKYRVDMLSPLLSLVQSKALDIQIKKKYQKTTKGKKKKAPSRIWRPGDQHNHELWGFLFLACIPVLESGWPLGTTNRHRQNSNQWQKPAFSTKGPGRGQPGNGCFNKEDVQVVTGYMKRCYP